MSSKVLPLTLLFVHSFAFFDDHDSKDTMQALAHWHVNFPQEKAYVQQDKPYYVLGETLWFKVYLLHAVDHSFITPSQTVYVELISHDQNILARRNIRISDGAGTGDILLDPSWESGQYTLRAFTQYMLNYDHAFLFQRSFEVGKIAKEAALGEEAVTKSESADESYQDLLIRSYPEGGDWVCGLKSVVAVKSQNRQGMPKPIKARVLDDEGQVVTLFATDEQGHGKFAMIPDCTRKYRIQPIDDPSGGHALPAAKAEGYTLSLKNVHREEFFVEINASPGKSLAGAYVVGHLRGDAPWLYDQMEGTSAAFSLRQDQLAGGVHHITLFAADGRPVAERLLYIHPTITPVRIQLDRASAAGKLSRIGMSLEVSKFVNDPDKLQAAASIYDHGLGLAPDPLAQHLLLHAELPGAAQSSVAYFEDPFAPNLKGLDLVMLTNGWRRFKWEDVINGNYPLIKHPPENGFTLSGITMRSEQKSQPIQAEILLTTLGANLQMMKEASDEKGHFAFRDLQILDTTGIILRAQKADTGKKRKSTSGDQSISKRTVFIDLFDRERQARELPVRPLSKFRLPPSMREGYADRMRYNYEVDGQYASVWSIDLDEVVVKGSKTDADVAFHEPGMAYKDPDNRIMINDFPAASSYTNIFDFLRGKVPGVEVIGSYPNRTARIRGTNTIQGNPNASFLLDGATVTSSILNNFPMDRIAFIDVIKSLSKSTALGNNQSGVIAVYTRRTSGTGTKASKSGNIVTFRHPGYYRAREFYNPLPSEMEEKKLNYRSTLYWNPNVTLQSLGDQMNFYTSNNAASYHVVVQGITDSGEFVYGSTTFQVQ